MSFSLDTYNQKKNELEIQKTEAEASFDGEQVGKIDKALEDLEKAKSAFEAKSENPGAITENQEKQIAELGGSVEDVKELTAQVDTKVEDVKEQTQEKIAHETAVETAQEKKELSPLQKKLEAAMLQKQQEADSVQHSIEVLLAASGGDVQGMLEKNPTHTNVARKLFEDGIIDADAFGKFIANNPDISANDRAYKMKLLAKDFNQDQIAKIRKSSETGSLFMKSIRADLKNIENTKGPYKALYPEMLGDILRAKASGDFSFTELEQMGGDPMAKVKEALKEWIALVGQNPEQKFRFIERSSASQIGTLLRIKGLPITREEVIDYVKSKAESGDQTALNKLVDLKKSGLVTEEEFAAF